MAINNFHFNALLKKLFALLAKSFSKCWTASVNDRRWHQYSAVRRESVLAQLHTGQRHNFRVAITRFAAAATDEVANFQDDLCAALKLEPATAVDVCRLTAEQSRDCGLPR